MRYDVNYKKLALFLTPIKLRKERFMAYLYVAVSELSGLARVFDCFREAIDYRLGHNGQVCYLRAVLNDMFDPLKRRIIIEDVPELNCNILYRRVVERFMMLPPPPGCIVLTRRGFGGIDSYDFAIVIPEELRTVIDTVRMAAIVNQYKLASKRFTIIYR